MLKATIIYLHGSGGNFLNRVLALSEKTIPFVDHYSTEKQATMKMSAIDRFSLYNRFSPEQWRQGEYSVSMKFIWGKEDFVDYELSPLWLIKAYHPHVFVDETAKGILWDQKDISWQNIIFITVDPEDLDFLNSVSKNKDYPPNGTALVELIKNLHAQYSDALTIPFKSFLDKSKFISEIKRFDKVLNLDLDFELVERLHESWLTASKECWSLEKVYPKNIYGQYWDNNTTPRNYNL